MRSLRSSLPACLAALVLAGPAGCQKGDTGSAGATGAPGTAVTTPTPTTVTLAQSLPGVVLTITGTGGGSGAGGAYQVGDTISVTFTVKKSDGTNLPASELNASAVYFSGPTFNYQRVIKRTNNWHTAAVQNTDGSYTYTFSSAIPATYAAPYNDTAAFGAGDGELTGQALLDGTYTIGMQASKNYTDEIGTTFSDVANVTKDVLFGAATTLSSREVVKTTNCNRCHVTLQVHGGGRRDTKLCVLCHTVGAEDAEDPLVTPGVTIAFKTMIHKIHNGGHLPSVLGVATNPDGTRNYAATPTPYVIDHDGELQDYSEVGFPVWPNMSIAMPKNAGYSALTAAQKTQDDNIRKGVTECSKCHGDPDGADSLTAPTQGDFYKTQPSRRACGSCHDDVDFTKPYAKNGKTMPAQADDTLCATCHLPSGVSADPADPPSVEDAHKHPLNDSTVSKGANFAITAVAGGTGAGGNFQAGDTPQITFTIKDDDGTDVPFGAMDRIATVPVVGPTTNRQPVYFVNPFPTVDPWDFTGRLARIDPLAVTVKGSMSKIVPSSIAATETLIVQFTSATAFTVTGSASGALGGSALPASPSTNPAKSSISNLILTSAVAAQTITVGFTSDTAFTVTGSAGGAMGGGTLPANKSAAVRFVSTDGSVAFTVNVGTTAFAAGNNIYMTVFKGAAANPVQFAVVAGPASFSVNDRFYYDVVKAATSYTSKLPMDIMPYELLGAGTGVVGQALVAGNLPVYYGRQSVYERTGLVGVATALTASSAAFARFVDVGALDAGLAVNDIAVLDNGVAAKEEYAQVGQIETTGGLKRVWFKTPLRFAHTLGAAFQEATLTFKQEGVDYTLTPATGTVTSVIAFGAANPVVMSYRSDARFGWKRFPGDALQTTYFPPPMDSASFDETWGEWAGKTYADGTYTVGIWGSFYIDLPLNGEVQTYRITRVSSRKDFLYGAATTVSPYGLISSGDNCNRCHTRVTFHGGGYVEAETCLLCHAVAGTEDTAQYYSATAAATPGITVNYRTMLHKIHRGADLANAATYQVGNTKFDEIEFPAMPGGVKHCDTCHGTSTAWKEPASRNHPTQQGLPARVWRATCGSCHDSTSAGAHIDLQTSGGAESCSVCHGQGAEFEVELMHKNR